LELPDGARQFIKEGLIFCADKFVLIFYTRIFGPGLAIVGAEQGVSYHAG
jgi:hypothetical protein